MAKFANADYIDGAHNIVKLSADVITYTLCSTQPTTRLEAVTTYMLASTTLNKTTEVTIAAGDVAGGRKMTISAKPAISVTNSGSGQHVAVCDATRLLFVTTTTTQAVSAGGTVDIGSWKNEIAAPA